MRAICEECGATFAGPTEEAIARLTEHIEAEHAAEADRE